MVHELKLFRDIYTLKSTIGKLNINGTFFCYTLEDYCRDKNRDGDLQDPGETKVYGQTCIPAGRYKVVGYNSPRFKKFLPLLVDVPGYAGVLMHNGNKPEHSKGCILVGASKTIDFVGNSVDTLTKLMIRLRAYWSAGHEVYITIIDKPAI